MPKHLRRKRRKLVFTKGVAHLPNTVERTKLKSENSMTIIRSGDTLLGTLILGRGSVQWWPSGEPRERCEEELETICGFA